MKTIYVAGPMTGLPLFNFPTFHAEAARLRAMGWQVENPAENDNGDQGRGDAPWDVCLRNAIRQLMNCDAVCLLPGWQNSRGATLEATIAEALGMTIWMQGEVPPIS